MLNRLGFWLLLPITAVQGLWLRRSALRLPGASGERHGSTGTGESVQLLAIGDSIIDGVGTGTVELSLPVQFARALAEQRSCCVHWRIEGRTGDGIDQVINRLSNMNIESRPDIVLISVGVNDVTGLSSARHWRNRLVSLLDWLTGRWPGTRIIFAGLPPMSLFPLPPQPLKFSLGRRAAMFDRIAAELIAAYPGAVHVPTRISPRDHSFCADGFHPSAESCTLWARELAAIEDVRSSI